MSRRLNSALFIATLLFTLPLHAKEVGYVHPVCTPQNTVVAKVVALDEAFYNNRLGTFQSGGMIFALERDIQSNDKMLTGLYAGKVMLRANKRPRPIVLRMNAGDCLDIHFNNLLSVTQMVENPVPPPVPWEGKSNMVAANPSTNPLAGYGAGFIQPPTRWAGVHVMGLQPVKAWDENGTEIEGISADGSWAGRNDITANIATDNRASGLVRPGHKMRYLLYAPAQSEGSYLLYSTSATNGIAPTYGGQLMQGLFGSVTVQPREAEYYRSQVTKKELWMATEKSAGKTLTPTSKTVSFHDQTYKIFLWGTREVIIMDEDGNPASSGGLHTTEAQPIVNYQAVDGAGTPILRMTKGTAPRELVHSDLTAIITGKNAGYVTHSPFYDVPTTPDAHEPWREFAIHYHDDFAATQAFIEMTTGNLQSVFTAGQDLFAINYGMGGIGAEILANRLTNGPEGMGVGPQAKCATCMYEEFFLSSWAVGDPAMVVDSPANNRGKKANKALYPDDPSNVYHSYVGDHVIFQILHAGTNITHVHHMHAQQWLHSPRNANGAYRDSQMISPGASFTLNHVYNGSGNVNKTIGDSIFHCHFYPHFAQGMWAMWRVHDMFEEGTKLEADGTASPGWNRALPDGEIAYGTPTPAIVPLPKLSMPLMPARVRLVPVEVAANGNKPVGYMTEVHPESCGAHPEKCQNPGYPFFVPGVAGQRAPHPPLDFAWETDANGKPVIADGKTVLLDGGLPRHLALWDTNATHVETRWDFTKVSQNLTTVELPEGGTLSEQVAMKFNGHRTGTAPVWPSFTPSGDPCTPTHPCAPPSAPPHKCLRCEGFEVNGEKSQHGAPFANPNRRLDGTQQCKEEGEDDVAKVLDPEGDWKTHKQPCLIRYKAADIQIDAVFNKAGWHFPQTRLLSLWGDVDDTVKSKRMPEPFFFRANSEQIIEYWHTNLVPDFYELDDFQVRTPTDVIGQHIHLVKFDVTSSDGAGNGYNYEDGTLGPEMVVNQIKSTNQCPNGPDGRPATCGKCPAGIFASLNITNGVGSPVGPQRCLTPKTIPYFGAGPDGHWLGAQTTIQRWSADPVFGIENFGKKGDEHHPNTSDPERKVDRTLRTVFTHDHFGPSTHQQAGLYAGLLVEPNESVWKSGESDLHYGSNLNRPPGADGRPPLDGGPTGWQARVIDRKKLDDRDNSYREFALEFADSQLAYTAASVGWKSPYYLNEHTEQKNPNYTGWADPAHAIGAPGNPLAGSPSCTIPSGPTPELVTNLVPTGTYSVNYRNEPLSLRLSSATPTLPPGLHPSANATDLSFAFASLGADGNPLLRKDAQFNVQPTLGQKIAPAFNNFVYPGPFTAAQPTDPYTPLLRAYAGDQVQVRTLVGAHLSPHFFNFHGVNWLFEPQEDDSGYRSAQGMGISEHYEMIFKLPATSAPTADYLYETTSDTLGRKNGNWGILRSYSAHQTDLKPLPNNSPGAKHPAAGCPDDAKPRKYAVRATRVKDVTNLPALYYNTRGQAGASPAGSQKLGDPDAIIYVDEKDIVNGKLKNQDRIEPLILRASAGECVVVTLNNKLPATSVSSSAVTPNFTVGFAVTGTEQQVNNWWLALSGTNGCTKAFYTTTGPDNFRDAFNQNPYGYQLPVNSQDTTKLQWNCVIPAGNPACSQPANCPASGVPMLPATSCSTTITLAAVGGAPAQTFYVGRDANDPKRLWVQATQQVQMSASTNVGLHASLLQYDVRSNDGMNVGMNPTQSIEPGQSRTYEWYAGRYQKNPNTHEWHHFPIEYGSVNLNPSDPLLQHPHGLIGALIVEPYGASWDTDSNSKASALVRYSDASGAKRYFREFVAVIQDDVPMQISTSSGFSTSNSTGLLGGWTRAFNYKVEPMGYRYISPNFLQNTASNAPSGIMRAQSDQLTLSDPQTPVFAAGAGQAVRIRMLHPAGLNEQVLNLHGHGWEEEPYLLGIGPTYAPGAYPDTYIAKRFEPAGKSGVAAAVIGHNHRSQRIGSRDSFGPNISWDLVIGEYENGAVHDGAGGVAKTYGDYMFRTFIGTDFFNGLWGILRVGETGKDIVTVAYYTDGRSDKRFAAGVKGTVTANTGNGKVASKVGIWSGTSMQTGHLVQMVDVNQNTGEWSTTSDVDPNKLAPPIFVQSSCTANCAPIGPWGSITMKEFIPTTGDPKQEQAATSAPPANLNDVKGTAPTNFFRKEVNQPELPPAEPQPPQPQPPQP
jgi:manganese oxidase